MIDSILSGSRSLANLKIITVIIEEWRLRPEHEKKIVRNEWYNERNKIAINVRIVLWVIKRRNFFSKAPFNLLIWI